ncbi:MAG: heavy metal-associated domain-containing protein [Patescibacteria group bacterium]
MHKITFFITNLSCDACTKISEMSLKKIPSVLDVNIRLNDGRAELVSSEQVSQELIRDALSEKGYKVSFNIK